MWPTRVLDPDEAVAIAEQFGVAAEQVRRDHLLSHLLSALAVGAGDQVVFFGGTALARTHLPDGRLSEDIDLLAVGDRSPAVADVEATLAAGARREYGRLTWEPALRETHGSQSAVLRTVDGISCSARPATRRGRRRFATSISGTAMPRPLDCGSSRVLPSLLRRRWPGTTGPRPGISTIFGRWSVSARWTPRH